MTRRGRADAHEADAEPTVGAAAPRAWFSSPRGPLRGELRMPGDKSISHRALVLNALADGPARVRGLLDADDVRSTATALRALGVEIEAQADGVIVRPPARGLVEPDVPLDCGNSGTTMRLLAGALAARPLFAVLTGDASLRRRPMDRVLQPLAHMGARVDGRAGGRFAPVTIRGGDLQMLHHALPIASAQVKSALLLAGLRCGVAVKEPRPSRDHTERMLARMGATLRRAPDSAEPQRPRRARRVATDPSQVMQVSTITGSDWLVLLPTDRLSPLDVDVPGDLSSAAFFLVAAAIVPGSDLRLRGVGVNPTRAGVIDALRAMGARIDVEPLDSPGAEPTADLRIRAGALQGTLIGGELSLRCIDEIPALAIAAAFAEGETIIRDAAELRVKESDRIARVVQGLRSMGVEVEELPDGMIIRGGGPRAAGLVDATGDHRIAMAFAVAGLAAPGGVQIVGAESITSSYPSFRADLERLR